jgi:hypothetical protein
MTIYDERSARRTAIEVVTAGLQGGAIRLIGPVCNDQASSNGTADALYLSHLIAEIAVQLKSSAKKNSEPQKPQIPQR